MSLFGRARHDTADGDTTDEEPAEGASESATEPDVERTRHRAVSDAPDGVGADPASPGVVQPLQDLASAYTRLAEVSEQRAAMFDQLYEELQERRARDNGDHLMPLLRAMVAMIDRIDGLIDAEFEDDGDLRSIRNEAVDILMLAGVEHVAVNPNSIDPSLQRVIGTEELPRDEVWREVAPGYRLDDRVVRHQQVVAALDAPGPSANDQ